MVYVLGSISLVLTVFACRYWARLAERQSKKGVCGQDLSEHTSDHWLYIVVMLLPRRVRVVINYIIFCFVALIAGLLHIAFAISAAAQLEDGIWGKMALYYGATLVLWLILLWLPIASISAHKTFMRFKAEQDGTGL